MAERPFTQADLDVLAQWDTPTICNGLEIIAPERRALRLHRRADGVHRSEGQADRRPGAGRHDPLHRAAARQGDRPRRLVRLRRTPPISRPSR